jgi:intein-encoded DNA endonuclease-like protein
MSDRAYRNYRKENLAILKKNLKLIVTKVDMIEYAGGGSCRCLTSEEYANAKDILEYFGTQTQDSKSLFSNLMVQYSMLLGSESTE